MDEDGINPCNLVALYNGKPVVLIPLMGDLELVMDISFWRLDQECRIVFLVRLIIAPSKYLEDLC